MFYPKDLFINSMTFGGLETCRILYINPFQKEAFLDPMENVLSLTGVLIR